MTITYIFQILEAAAEGDVEKYGVIPDMNAELQKAVRRSRRRIARLRARAQYELGEMDKAKVAAANDNIRRFTKALGKIRNLNLEDCRGVMGIEAFLEDGTHIHEVVEMAKKISHLSAVSGTAYTPMSLGFGVLEFFLMERTTLFGGKGFPKATLTPSAILKGSKMQSSILVRWKRP